MGAVEQPVQEGDQGAVGRCVVHGRSDHQAVAGLELGSHCVDGVVKDALALFGAGAAGDAAPDGLVANLNGFHLDALLGENLFHLLQGNGGIAPHPGTAVDHKNFHVCAPHLF